MEEAWEVVDLNFLDARNNKARGREGVRWGGGSFSVFFCFVLGSTWGPRGGPSLVSRNKVRSASLALSVASL